jgi:hypothetical protein
MHPLQPSISVCHSAGSRNMAHSSVHAQLIPRLRKSGCATRGRPAAKMDRMNVVAATALAEYCVYASMR